MFREVFRGFMGGPKEQPKALPGNVGDSRAAVAESFRTRPTAGGPGLDRGGWEPEPRPKSPTAEQPKPTVAPPERPLSPFDAEPLRDEEMGAWTRTRNSPSEPRKLPEQDQDAEAA